MLQDRGRRDQQYFLERSLLVRLRVLFADLRQALGYDVTRSSRPSAFLRTALSTLAAAAPCS